MSSISYEQAHKEGEGCEEVAWLSMLDDLGIEVESLEEAKVAIQVLKEGTE